MASPQAVRQHVCAGSPWDDPLVVFTGGSDGDGLTHPCKPVSLDSTVGVELSLKFHSDRPLLF